MQQQTDKISALIQPVIEAMGYSLWGCELMQEGHKPTLSVYVDSDKGVNLDDCQAISRQISAILDVEDAIASAYTLEVSSPGLNRRFFTPAQMQAYIGQLIKVKAHSGVDGRRKFKGELRSVSDDELCIRVDGVDFTLVMSDVAKANLEF